ncbi:phage tail protein [Bombella sp. ESL0385]|uniref:phage tail protein n=1 Tax=Bombella sp. ESL0385 TaxID=2676446 RepID=UPI0012D99BE1|nr:phage tail protein [Bombella sp. ESL0385]MUG89647.1 hypothetical protein [Bombella sp. ESL0385]
MTSMTVSNEGGRVRVPDLPTLSAPQAGDRVLGLQGSVVGLFPASSLGGGNIAAPDLSAYAKKSDLPDISGLVTSQQLAQHITQAIEGIQLPSIEGLAKQADLTTEATARQAADTALEQRINQVSATIPAPPDLSGYAKQTDLTTETTAREQADTALTQRMSSVEQKLAEPPAPSTGGLAAGVIAYFAGTSPPENWRVRDGSSFPMDVYPELAKIYPSGFLPNDCGLFIRGYDPSGYNDPDGPTRGFASYQEGSAAAGTSTIGGRVGIPVFFSGDFRAAGLEQPAAGHYPSKPGVSNPFQSSFFDIHTPAPDNAWAQVAVTRPKNRNYLPIIYAGLPVK